MPVKAGIVERKKFAPSLFEVTKSWWIASWAAAAVGEMADSELTLCSLSKPEKYIKLFRTFYEINDLAKLINIGS